MEMSFPLKVFNKSTKKYSYIKEKMESPFGKKGAFPLYLLIFYLVKCTFILAWIFFLIMIYDDFWWIYWKGWNILISKFWAIPHPFVWRNGVEMHHLKEKKVNFNELNLKEHFIAKLKRLYLSFMRPSSFCY